MGAAISSPIAVQVAATYCSGSAAGANRFGPEFWRCYGAFPPPAMENPGRIPILREMGAQRTSDTSQRRPKSARIDPA
jgi:hypothetical protein